MLRPYRMKNAGLIFSGALPIAVFLLLAMRGWGKWPDLLIDSGGELYVPWRLSCGDALYRDVAWFKGPLAPYANALLFRVFGACTPVLTLANLSLIALVTAGVFRFFRKTGDEISACACALVFLCVAAFGQLTTRGSFSWAFPYSHDLTWGVALGVVLLLLWQAVLSRPKKRLFALGGAILGLVFLTKAEAALAALALCAFGWVFLALIHRPSIWRLSAWVGIFLGAFGAVILAALVLLAVPLGLKGAAHGLLSGYLSSFSGDALSIPFYSRSIGFDRPLANIIRMILAFLGIMSALGAALALAASLSPQKPLERVRLIGASALLAVLALIAKSGGFPIILEGRALALISLAAFCAYWWKASRANGDAGERARCSSMALWAAFSFFLLAKIILAPRLTQFGFALAMPAALLLTGIAIHDLPLLAGRAGAKGVFRFLVIIMLVLDLLFFLKISEGNQKRKNFAVSRGRDTIMTQELLLGSGPAGPEISELLEEIKKRAGKGETLVALPEGIMVNYLLRMRNPTPFINFMPTEMLLFGEGRILSSFKSAPPGWIAYIPKNTADFGYGWFGEDPRYGKEIMDWVRRSYDPVWELPNPRLPGQRYSIVLWRKKPGPI